MDSLLNVSRRALVKMGLAAAGIPMFTGALGVSAFAQDAGSEAGKKGALGGRSEEELYPGKGLPGGGQLEIRLTQSMFTSDPDALEVAQRMKPFNLESWINEWTRVADRNAEQAEKLAADGYKVTANEFYLRASGFYRHREDGRDGPGDPCRWTSLACCPRIRKCAPRSTAPGR